MGTPNPCARGDGGLRATLEAARKDREQLRRLTSNLTQPNVFSSDGQKLVIPGHTAMTDNAGKVLTVNATGDEYELAAAAGGGGGGGPVGTTRATVTGYSGGSTTYSPDTWAAADVPTYY
ncbi:MAG: hypothetical protein JWP31_154, partial [Aeromicrobium sp.]|nr:hypothetical protein [Aeromicrobium sp.]